MVVSFNDDYCEFADSVKFRKSAFGRVTGKSTYSITFVHLQYPKAQLLHHCIIISLCYSSVSV